MSEMYNYIVKKYYYNILIYCNAQLDHDMKAAEDCTQEVFLTLARKINKLDLSTSIQNWLYRVANQKIKAYVRKNPPTINIDELPEMPDYESELGKGSILDELTEDEKRLIKLYYSGEDKLKIASAYGITLCSLQSRVKNIKKKLKKEYADSTK